MEKRKRNMLPPADGEKYFELFLPLLCYADLTRPIFFGEYDDMMRRAAILWKDTSLIDSYLRDLDQHRLSMKVSLTQEEREILLSWKRCRQGIYYVARHDINGSLLVSKQDSKVYRVLGLQSTLEEMLPNPPHMVLATILPWKTLLITDGLFALLGAKNDTMNKARLNRICDQAIQNGTVCSYF